jgi:DNA-binding CsgD family transcriptional regulator
MKADIEDFFKPVSASKKISVYDSQRLAAYIETAEAFARASYQSVYIVDYRKRGFAYVSDHPFFLCGYTADKVKNMGYGFYLNQVPAGDIDMLVKANAAAFGFFESVAAEDRKYLSMSCDFHLLQPGKHTILINNKATPLACDDEGRIWLVLCVNSLSSQKKSGNVIMQKAGDPGKWSFDLGTSVWKRVNDELLSEKEKEILYFSVRGFTMKEIASRLSLSPETIKYHKKNIFRKLHVKSITEAVTCAANYSLI